MCPHPDNSQQILSSIIDTETDSGRQIARTSRGYSMDGAILQLMQQMWQLTPYKQYMQMGGVRINTLNHAQVLKLKTARPEYTTGRNSNYSGGICNCTRISLMTCQWFGGQMSSPGLPLPYIQRKCFDLGLPPVMDLPLYATDSPTELFDQGTACCFLCKVLCDQTTNS